MKKIILLFILTVNCLTVLNVVTGVVVDDDGTLGVFTYNSNVQVVEINITTPEIIQAKLPCKVRVETSVPLFMGADIKYLWLDYNTNLTFIAGEAGNLILVNDIGEFFIPAPSEKGEYRLVIFLERDSLSGYGISNLITVRDEAATNAMADFIFSAGFTIAILVFSGLSIKWLYNKANSW